MILRSRGDSVFLPASPEELAKLNFNDHSTLAPAVWAVNVTFIVIVIIVVALRTYTRACITRQFFSDDVLIVLAAASLFISACTALVATRHGLGQHVWDLPLPLSNMLESMQRCVQLMFVSHIFYALGTAFTKLSIIISYLRMFPSERLRKLLYATAVVVVGLGASAVFGTIFQCSPIRAAWDFTIHGARCYSFVDFLYAISAINIATDFVICFSPLPCFWRLRIPLRRKLMVLSLFGIGFVACIVSIVRIAFLHEINSIDMTYGLVVPLNWTVIECSLAIICVSIPPMRPLYLRLVPGLARNHQPRSGANGSWAGQRTQAERLEDMNRELDRQLMEFVKLEESQKTRTLSAQGLISAEPSGKQDQDKSGGSTLVSQVKDEA